MPKAFPKLDISSHRKRYEGHGNVTLQAERFRRHVSHAKEFQVEYSVVKLCCDGSPAPPHCHVRAGHRQTSVPCAQGDDAFPNTA